ncbi:DUF3450 family protein [Methyloprofundus sedimenti]|nr:DUF3450 family protein [Methyloprofundus sedimenti]
MLVKIFKISYLVCISICMAWLGNANAEEHENLAKSLSKVRGEVEELQMQFDLAKENHHNQMSSLASQMTDLGVEERRQNISIEKLQQSLEKFQQESQKAAVSNDGLKPVLIELITRYRVYVRNGFPFKVEDRLSDVNKLESQLNNNLIDAKKVVNRMWAFIEDEIRLSKENGIYQQTIELDNEKVLADIAKLGTALMYFQTGDKRVGMASRKSDGNWQYLETTNNQEIEQIAMLFDSLKKQIRQGYFELPNPLKS